MALNYSWDRSFYGKMLFMSYFDVVIIANRPEKIWRELAQLSFLREICEGFMRLRSPHQEF